MTELANTQYDFRGKYETRNPIAVRLLDGFYRGVADLVRRANLDSYCTVLEVGCGEGYSTAQLTGILPPAVRLSACDVEPRLVEAARNRNPDIAISQQSIYGLEADDNSYDLVVCMEVLEHLNDPEQALRELCRVTGRWLIVTVPREPIWRILNMARGKYLSALGNTPGHLQHWSRHDFERFVSHPGRTIVAHRSPLPWTQLLVCVT